jgi:hypothetical protein
MEIDCQILCPADIREYLMAGIFGRPISEADNEEGAAEADVKSSGWTPAATRTSTRDLPAPNSPDMIAEGGVDTVLDQFLSAQFAQAVGFFIADVEVRSYRSQKIFQ